LLKLSGTYSEMTQNKLPTRTNYEILWPGSLLVLCPCDYRRFLWCRALVSASGARWS